MPKRSTTFQELIELLERQLAPLGSKITASKLLKDNRTGEDREVDIVIETSSGIHPIIIAIEVIERKRPATTPWIESISKKHEDLPIHKSIAVSKSGFYKPALKKAALYKIDTLSLEEANNIDWKAKLDNLQSVTIGSFLIPKLTHAILVFEDSNSIDYFSEIDIGNLELHKNPGELSRVLKDYLDSVLKDPNFISTVEEKAFTDSDTVIDGILHLPKGSFVLDADQNKHNVDAIKFRAKCRKQVMKADLVKGRYRDVAVALASGKSFDKNVQIVISEKRDGDNHQISFRIKNNK